MSLWHLVTLPQEFRLWAHLVKYTYTIHSRGITCRSTYTLHAHTLMEHHQKSIHTIKLKAHTLTVHTRLGYVIWCTNDLALKIAGLSAQSAHCGYFSLGTDSTSAAQYTHIGEYLAEYYNFSIGCSHEIFRVYTSFNRPGSSKFCSWAPQVNDTSWRAVCRLACSFLESLNRQ